MFITPITLRGIAVERLVPLQGKGKAGKPSDDGTTPRPHPLNQIASLKSAFRDAQRFSSTARPRELLTIHVKTLLKRGVEIVKELRSNLIELGHDADEFLPLKSDAPFITRLGAIVTLIGKVRTLYGGFKGYSKRSLTRMRRC